MSIPNLADLTLIEQLHKKRDDIARNRQAVEKQMFKNIAYLYGKQHFIINRRGGNTLRDKIWFAFEKIEASKKERKVSNKILVYYRSLLSRLLKMRAVNTVEPLTRMKRDVDAAKVAEEVLEDIWNNVNRNNPYVSEHLSGMQMVQKYLYQYMLALGSGYLVPEFNPNIEVKALVDGQIRTITAGEVEVRVAHPLNVYKDPLNRFLIEREVMSLDEVYYRWGVDVEPEEPELPQAEQQLLTLIDKTDYTELRDAVTIFRYYQHPNKDFPNGRIVVYTNKKIIQDIDLPNEHKGKIPYFEFHWFDLLLSPTTKQGIVEQLMPLQDEYNFTISRIAEYKKHFGGKIFVPDGANLQTKFHNAIGQIIKYVAGREPKFVIPPNPPQYLFTDLDRIEKDMQDIAMTHDPTLAQVPTGVKCCDIKTECLTKEGFKKYNQIKKGDYIYTFNKKSKKAEWKKVNKVFIYKKYKGDIYKIDGLHISACVTPNHKWVVENHGKIKVKEMCELNTADKILLSAKNAENKEEIYTDDFVALVGWVITEGTYSDGNKVSISQSFKSNSEKVKKIRSILENKDVRYFERKTESNYGWHITFAFKLGKMIKKMFPKKELTYEFVNQLSTRQLEILLNALIDGDGNIRCKGWKRFFTISKNMAEIFQYICILLGKNCSITKYEKSKKNKKWKDYYECHVKVSKTASPYLAGKQKKSRKNPCCVVKEKYSGIVWCPNTENETFFARRNGKVYITGNSGIGIQALTEKDDFTLTPTTMEIEEKFSHFNDMILDIVAERYDVQRILSITGTTPTGAEPEIKSFLGEDVKGNRRIKTSLGSALPHSRTARQQYLIELVQVGILSPQEAKAHLEMGDVGAALDNVDERLAKEEIEEILKGGTPVPQEWQDHKVFVDVVRKFMTEPSFKELSKDVRMVMIAYYRQHLEMLQEEIQAAMQMQTGQGQQSQPVAVQ